MIKFWLVLCNDTEELTPVGSPLVWLDALYIPIEHLKKWRKKNEKLNQASTLFSGQ